jgi:hypothetical protein
LDEVDEEEEIGAELRFSLELLGDEISERLEFTHKHKFRSSTMNAQQSRREWPLVHSNYFGVYIILIWCRSCDIASASIEVM